jgi:uncharacterized membrane protein
VLKHLTWRVTSNRHLDQPRRSLTLAPHYDPDAFGRVSEGIARYFGTARYLVIQTMMVIVWMAINAVWASGRWDGAEGAGRAGVDPPRPRTPRAVLFIHQVRWHRN